MAWRTSSSSNTASATDLRSTMGLRGGGSNPRQVTAQTKKPTRKMVTIGVVAVAFLAAMFAVCRSSSAGSVDLTSATLTPADTFFYAAVNTDLDSSQWVEAFKLAEKFGAEDARQQLEDSVAMGGDGADWQTDVAPFLGGDAAFFLREVTGDGGFDGGVILRCRNTTEAMRVLREQAEENGVTLERRPYAGGVYEADDAMQTYVAVLDDHIVITMNESTLRDVINTYRREAPALSESPAFQAVRDGLVKNFLAFTYIDPNQVKAADEDILEGIEESGFLGSERTAFGGVLTASKDLFTAEQAFPAAEGDATAMLAARTPAFADRVPEHTALFVSITGLATAVAEAQESGVESSDFAGQGDYALDAADLAWIFAGAPFELAEMGDLAKLMTGELAVASWPPTDDAEGGSALLAEVDDAETARSLAVQLAAGHGDLDASTTETIGGVEVTVVGEGAVTVLDGVLIAGSLEGVRQVIEGPESPLTASPIYQRATQQLGTPLGSFVFFNVVSFFSFEDFAFVDGEIAEDGEEADPMLGALESILLNAVTAEGLTRLGAIVLAGE